MEAIESPAGRVSFLSSITRANRILNVIAGARAVLHCDDDWVTPEKILDYYQKVFAKDFGDTTLEEIEDTISQFAWFLDLKLSIGKIIAARYPQFHKLAAKNGTQEKSK